MFDLFKNGKIRCIKKLFLAVFFASLGWGIPVTASAPNTQSIPNWSDVYIFPVSIINYTPLNLEPTDFDPTSCISFAKSVLGYPQWIKWGNAKEIVPNSDEPSIGTVVILDEGKFGHVAVVIDFTRDEITIIEANWIPGIITERTLKRDNPLIRGYRVYPHDK